MDFVDAAQQPLVDATAKLGLGPRGPVDATAFVRVTEAKARGNALFGTKRFVDAIVAYDEALGFFGLSWGSVAQRDEKVKIYSNRAECELKLGRWKEAAASAAAALGITPGHTKSLVRRARAYAELGELPKAEADVAALRASGGATTRDLAPVVARIKARRKGAGPASPGGASRAPAPAPRRPCGAAPPGGNLAASAWSRGLEGRTRVSGSSTATACVSMTTTPLAEKFAGVPSMTRITRGDPYSSTLSSSASSPFAIERSRTPSIG